jgi:PAS domain S-box-containing protein
MHLSGPAFHQPVFVIESMAVRRDQFQHNLAKPTQLEYLIVTEHGMNWDSRKLSVRVAESFAVMVLYFVAGRIGLNIPFTVGNISPVWPASGIAVGALLVRGRHVWPGIAAGVFLVEFVSHGPNTTALAVAVGGTLGPLISAYLLKRRSVTRICNLSDVLRLICFTGVGAAVSASFGAPAFFLTGIRVWDRLPAAMAAWWISDLLGCLLIVPLILNFAQLKTNHRQPELFLLITCLLAGSAFLFRQNQVMGSVLGFALTPFIIWGAVRFSIAGAALSSCLISAIAIWVTGRGGGPFVMYGNLAHHVEALQVFTAVITISGLCLAAVTSERDTVEEARAREEKLRRAQEQYRRIVETTNEGIWMLDREFRTTFVNRHVAEMLGYSAEEMAGRPLLDFFFPEDVAKKQEDLDSRRQGVAEVLYSRCRRKDGSEIWCLVSTNPVFNDRGEFTGVLAMLTDVTLLRKTEEALRRNEKLITAGRLAASISHEINNPLEAVINLLYLLKGQPLDEQSRQYVILAEKQILRVSAISKRTLGFFRDASAWVELPLPHLLDDTLLFYEHELGAHAIKVVREYGARGLVRVSQGEMQQVFANLISNALDAMDNGGVLTLRVSEVPDPIHPAVRVQVEDTGAGINHANLNRIFEPFFTTKQDTGTGLGLWVAREIVEKHGGTITVTSQTQTGGSGTQFSITLPAAIPAHAAA